MVVLLTSSRLTANWLMLDEIFFGSAMIWAAACVRGVVSGAELLELVLVANVWANRYTTTANTAMEPTMRTIRLLASAAAAAASFAK